MKEQMAILLTSLREMTPHFVIWCVILLLLWIASYKMKRMDRAWVISWEKKHNAPIETYKKSISRMLVMLRILQWVVGVTIFAMVGWIALKNSNLPQWGRVEVTKTTIILVFAFVILLFVHRIQKKRVNRLSELGLMVGRPSSE